VKEGRPSATATLIARSTLFLSQDPHLSPLIPPVAAEACRWFLEAGMGRPVPEWQVRLMGRGWVRALASRLERLAIPGIRLHYAVRKLYLEEAARRALAEGITQVLVLGAGFDTLALRLHREFPGVTFIECDHPATQRVKRLALEPRQALGPNLHLLPVDLARTLLPEALASLPEYRREADTLLVAEGLTMYLQPEEMDGLFAFLREETGPGSRFAFTFMERQAGGRVSFPSASPFVRPWLALVGEPFTWGVRREELPRYLEERGFTLAELATAETLRDRYLKPRGLAGRRLAVGEYVAVARKNR